MLLAGLMSLAVLAQPEVIVTSAPDKTGAMSAALSTPAEAVTTVTPTAQDAIPHGLNTEAQIQQWISNRSERPDFDEAILAAEQEPERRMHGMVEAGIGTNGYRNFGAAVSIPLGETGELNLMYRQSKNQPWGWDQPYARPRFWDAPYGLRNRTGTPLLPLSERSVLDDIELLTPAD